MVRLSLPPPVDEELAAETAVTDGPAPRRPAAQGVRTEQRPQGVPVARVQETTVRWEQGDNPHHDPALRTARPHRSKQRKIDGNDSG